jgi:CRISPR system Cascade subunit CasD
MNTYVALKLRGVMQAWGGHTFESLRHTELVPTRSGVLGLIAACLGIDRSDDEQLEALARSVHIAIRMDRTPERITDYHTVLDARKVDGKPRKFPVESWREYLCDAEYTVLLQSRGDAVVTAPDLQRALEKPVYTPFLGRRSCALSRPLFEASLQAVDFEAAFDMIEPAVGMIYSELEPLGSSTPYRLRDIPLYGRKRQFASRHLYVYQQGGKNAPE